MTARTSHDVSSSPSELGLEFDLHGVVGVRLKDASAADAALVRRQLGPLNRPLDREPDITIRFVERATTKPLTYVALGESGFNDDGFFVLRTTVDGVSKAQIPFPDVGQPLEIVCERTMPAVPHLLSLINLAALTKGVLPLHASAFTIDSTGVLVTGWAKGGKTETLLACMSRGAEYVGDEWVYLTEDGQMLGLPEPIRVWAWHLQQLPSLLKSRPRKDRFRLSAWRRLAEMTTAASRSSLPGAAMLRKGAPIIGRQAYLQIPPDDMFGPAKVTLHGVLGAVVLVVSREASEIAIEATSGSEIASRMAASLSDERSKMVATYNQFRFAYPDARSPVIESAEIAEQRLLSTLLDRLPAAKVLHPYPCDVAALGRAVQSAALHAISAAIDGACPDQRRANALAESP